MTISSSTSRARPDAGPLRVEQVYVTHCLQTDSVRNHAGFSIRAASTDDPGLHKFAFDYPAYELPMDMWSANPRPDQAPVRLAVVSGPGEATALIHSAYVEKDTVGRTGSYFTHVLLCDGLTLAEALQTWGSPEWKTSYPQGAKKELPPLTRLPAPGPVSEQALTAFLGGAATGTDQRLAAATCPARLPADPGHRHELLRLTLHGCLLALRQGAQSPRGRFYLLAEPGLTALLLYGVARLLPGSQVEGLTFSTYENMHRTLRQFKLAQVVGTFAVAAPKGLDAEFVTTRGYALDTFQTNRSSPELLGATSAEVNELVELAAQGAWAEVKSRYHYRPTETVTVESLAASRKLHDLVRRAQANQIQPAELVGLRGTPQGRLFMEQCPDLVWPLIRDGSLTSDAVRQEYADVLRAHVADLKAQAVRQLGASSWPKWQQYWKLFQFLHGGSKDRLRADLLDMLQQAEADPGTRKQLPRLRVPLLREWQGLHPSGGSLPPPVERLLVVETAAELGSLREGGLPGAWLGTAVRHALGKKETVAAAVQALQTADDELLQVFCRDILPAYGPEQQVLVVGMLCARQASENQQLLARLLESGLQVPPESLQKLLKDLRADEPGWLDFWLEGNHLALLLASVRAHGAGAGPLWVRFCAGVGKEFLWGNKTQRRLFTRLEEARKAVQKAVPREAAAVLDDWGLLLSQFESPGSGSAPQEINAACKRRCGMDFESLLKEFFARAIQDQPAEAAESVKFSDTVKTFYPQWGGGHYQHHLSMFQQWLGIIKDFKDPRRADFQLLFARRHIPVEHHASLAEDAKDKLARQAYEALRQAIPPTPSEFADLPGTSTRPREPALISRKRQKNGRSAAEDPDDEASWFDSLSPRTKLILALVLSHLAFFVLAFVLGRNQVEAQTTQAVVPKEPPSPPNSAGKIKPSSAAPTGNPKGEHQKLADEHNNLKEGYKLVLETLANTLQKDVERVLPTEPDIVSTTVSAKSYISLGSEIDKLSKYLETLAQTIPDLGKGSPAEKTLLGLCNGIKKKCDALPKPLKQIKPPSLAKSDLDSLVKVTKDNRPPSISLAAGAELAEPFKKLREDAEKLDKQLPSLGKEFEKAGDANAMRKYLEHCRNLQQVHKEATDAESALLKEKATVVIDMPLTLATKKALNQGFSDNLTRHAKTVYKLPAKQTKAINEVFISFHTDMLSPPERQLKKGLIETAKQSIRTEIINYLAYEKVYPETRGVRDLSKLLGDVRQDLLKLQPEKQEATFNEQVKGLRDQLDKLDPRKQSGTGPPRPRAWDGWTGQHLSPNIASSRRP